MYVNSIDKVVKTYFAGVCARPFHYRGVTHQPKTIRVSPLVFRGFTCPEMCAGCCLRFSLEYLPSESAHHHDRYSVLLNGRSVEMAHDPQDDHADHFCRNVNKADGRCMIHESRPFHCDFEPIRFQHHADRVLISQALFSRGWNFMRVDGERGALCDMIPLDDEWKADLIRRFRRLKAWTEHFKIDTHVDQIIEWCDAGPHERPLIIEQ